MLQGLLSLVRIHGANTASLYFANSLCTKYFVQAELSAAVSHIHPLNLNNMCFLLCKTTLLLSFCKHRHMEAQAYTVVQATNVA